MIDSTILPNLARFTAAASLLALPLAAQGAWHQAQDLVLSTADGSGGHVVVRAEGGPHALYFSPDGQDGASKQCCNHECKAQSAPRNIRFGVAPSGHGRVGGSNVFFSRDGDGPHAPHAGRGDKDQEVEVHVEVIGPDGQVHSFGGDHADSPHIELFRGTRKDHPSMERIRGRVFSGGGDGHNVMFFGDGGDGPHAPHAGHGDKDQNVEVRVKLIGPDGEVHSFDGGRGASPHGDSGGGHTDGGHGSSGHGASSHGSSSGEHRIERRVIIDGAGGGLGRLHEFIAPHASGSNNHGLHTWTSNDGNQTFMIKVESDGHWDTQAGQHSAPSTGVWSTHAPKAPENSCGCSCGSSESSPRFEVKSSRSSFFPHILREGNQFIEFEVENSCDAEPHADHSSGDVSFNFDVSAQQDGEGNFEVVVVGPDGQGHASSDEATLELHHDLLQSLGNGFDFKFGEPGQNMIFVTSDGEGLEGITIDLPDFESMDIEGILEWAHEQGDAAQVELNAFPLPLPAPVPVPKRQAPGAEQASQDIIIV